MEQELTQKENDKSIEKHAIKPIDDSSKTRSELLVVNTADAVDATPVFGEDTTVASPLSEEPSHVGFASAIDAASHPENRDTMAPLVEHSDVNAVKSPSPAAEQKRKDSGKSRRSTGDSAKLVVNASVKVLSTAAAKVINFAAGPFKMRGRPDRPSVAVGQQTKSKLGSKPAPPPSKPPKPEPGRAPAVRPTATKQK